MDVNKKLHENNREWKIINNKLNDVGKVYWRK